MKISISRNGVEIGEWTEEEIRSFYQEGQLLPTDHYWKEGMTGWAELSKMIKPPPPNAKPPMPAQKPAVPTQIITPVDTKPAARKTTPVSTFAASRQGADEPPTAGAFKEKKSFGWGYLLFFIGALFTKSLYATSNGNMEIFFGGLAAVIVIVTGFYFIASWLHKKHRSTLWILIGLCLVGAATYEYLQPDSLTQSLNQQSEAANKKLPEVIDSATRFDNTSVSANHTFHYCYTILTDETPDPSDIRALLIPTLKQGYIAHPELQKLRDRGVTFEYDYFKKDGTPLTQISVGPNDLK